MNSLLYLSNLLAKLKPFVKKSIKGKAFVGFDGYIDKIQKAVETRTDDKVTYYDTLTAFSKRLAAAAGKSGQVELVTKEIKSGGNAPIISNALASLGISNTCLGCAGYPSKHPEFQKLHTSVEMLSLGEPAETNALEFNDGKMILSELSTFHKIDWEYVKNIIGKKVIQKHVDKSDIISLVGWCNPDHATNVWAGILEEIMPYTRKKKLIFFDLADPTKKSKSDLLEVMGVINAFSKYGHVVLGINENELLKLFDTLKGDYPDEILPTGSLEEKGQFLFNKMEIAGILIHPIDRSIYISDTDAIELHAPVINEPKISTGGGDNFNAGFCLGFLLGFLLEESMILGMATSGAYVKYGKSPTIKELSDYLKSWH